MAAECTSGHVHLHYMSGLDALSAQRSCMCDMVLMCLGGRCRCSKHYDVRTALQGKYLGEGPREARLNKYRGRYAEAESRYGNKSNTVQAVQEYVNLAHEAGMSPATLAIRYLQILP